MKTTYAALLTCPLILLWLADSVNASIVGDNVQITGNLNSAGLTATVFNGVVIDPGVEYTDSFFPNEIERIDVFDDGFTWSYDHQNFGGGATSFFTFEQMILTGIDWVNDPLNGQITDVQLVSSNIASVSSIAFVDSPGLDSGQITINFGNFIVQEGEVATLEFSISSSDATGVIPEPATFATWSILGICSIGYHWRRRRKAA